MDYTERVAMERAARAQLTRLLAEHPLAAVEIDYLTELALECHGLGGVDKQSPQARAEFRWLCGYLESTSRISPREHRELLKIRTDGFDFEEDAE